MVETAYKCGTSIFCFPYRVVLSAAADGEKEVMRCLVNVSKKRFKHAVDRNRVKRQMREAYRLNKHTLYEYLLTEGKKIYLSIHFVGQKIEHSSFMHERMIRVLARVENDIREGKLKPFPTKA